VTGLVLAPQVYYDSPGQRRNAVDPARRLIQAMTPTVDICLATWGSRFQAASERNRPGGIGRRLLGSRVGGAGAQTGEVLLGIDREVEVELGVGLLHDAPGRLPGIGDQLHEVQRGARAVGGGLAMVGLQPCHPP
jgi:hypothetical protein